jgi:hypothetical protein
LVSNVEPEDKVELEEVEKSIEEKLEMERLAWDSFGPGWTRVQDQIKREKDQRHHELLVIDRRKGKISEWKKRLEQMQYDLTARETRVLESEAFLPLARKLQEMKLALEDVLPWIQTINEVTQIQNMDIKTAAIFVTEELRLNREFSGIQRQIEMAQGQLKMLNISITQRQPVITALLKLQHNGVKDDDIIGLSKIIDLSRMGREWTPFGSRTGQGNGPNGNYNVNSSSNSNNGNGNFSMNDLIKLNLLKSNTTNMLNRSH